MTDSEYAQELEEEIKQRLINLKDVNSSTAHVMADAYLCLFLKKIGFNSIVEIYEQITKDYGSNKS